jgi:hypothetical protein
VTPEGEVFLRTTFGVRVCLKSTGEGFGRGGLLDKGQRRGVRCLLRSTTRGEVLAEVMDGGRGAYYYAVGGPEYHSKELGLRAY